MSFTASNDRILIKDTNGDITFDTDSDIPHITGYYEGTVHKAFVERYYTEEYFNLGPIPDKTDFVMCSAVCTPYNMNNGTENVGYETISAQKFSVNIPWVRMAPQGECFFQGSLMLEGGCTGLSQKVISQYARRALHIYPEPAWGNRLVCMFQQSVKSGFGAVPGGNLNMAPGNTLYIDVSTLEPYTGPIGKGTTPPLVATWSKIFNPNNPTVRAYGQLLGFIKTENLGMVEEWTLDVFDPVVTPVLIATGQVSSVTYGTCAIRWTINLKVWYGRFR